jgi:hypothetical protein
MFSSGTVFFFSPMVTPVPYFVAAQDGKIYTVVFGLVIILTAMIILLIRLDRKISRLEAQKRSREIKMLSANP